jgi:hypothetical protein
VDDEMSNPELPGYEVCLRIARPILPRQLTRMSGSESPYPVRVRTTSDGQESQADNGFKTGQDKYGGWFGFRGLTDDQGPEPARIYYGKLSDATSSATATFGDPGSMKDLAVNAAVEHDLRIVNQQTLGTSDPWSIASAIDTDAPPSLAMKDCQTRRYDIQVNSQYAPGATDLTATFGTVTDDRTLLADDAKQIMKESGRLRLAARIPICEPNELLTTLLTFPPGTGVGDLILPGTQSTKTLNACVVRAEYRHRLHTTTLHLEGF